MPPHEAAIAVLSNFTGCCPKGQLQRVERAGFSGSSLWKVHTGDGFLCLKRWSQTNPPPARLPWIHGILAHARQQGLAFLPEFLVTRDGRSTCEYAGSTWELMTWLPGQADYWTHPSPRRLQSALRALARFHLATSQWSKAGSDLAETLHPAPAIAERLQRLNELTSCGIPAIQAAVAARRIPEIDDLAQQWLASRRLPPALLLPRLTTAARQPAVVQPAIRDLWHDHVLFTGEEVTGFIDFGALRLDTPIVDLARLIGSLAGNDPVQRELAVRAYADVRPIEPAEVALLDLLDHSGTWIAGWNWLDWLYREEREFPSLEAVRERLAHLLGRAPAHH